MKPSIPSCQLQELVEAHIKCIHEHLKAGTDSFAPTLLVESIRPLEEDADARHLDVIVIAVDEKAHEKRHEIMETLGKKYHDEQRLPLGIAFASEAWTSTTLHCRPSEADDRQEVLFIAAKSINGEAIMQTMPLARDKDGNIIEAAFVARDEWSDAHTFLLDSFFAGFWKPYLEQRNRR